MITIEVVNDVSDELIEAFARLIPQLSSSGCQPGAEGLGKIVFSTATLLYIARDSERQNEIVGTLTLAIYHIPTGTKAWIEDVVVDEGARGKRIGELLCQAALDQAKSAGAKGVDLTSRPARVAANRLYQRMGFQLRKTNSYRYNFPKN
jgi:ribosomal protein S18 acetylase RimI-like enzyme